MVAAKAGLAAECERTFAVAIHIVELEGLTVSEAAVSESAAYVAGEFGSSDLSARARARRHLT